MLIELETYPKDLCPISFGFGKYPFQFYKWSIGAIQYLLRFSLRQKIEINSLINWF